MYLHILRQWQFYYACPSSRWLNSLTVVKKRKKVKEEKKLIIKDDKHDYDEIVY